MDENKMTFRAYLEEEESSREPATVEEYETGLPPFLQHDLDAYKEVLRTNSKYLDCLWGELYPKISIPQEAIELLKAEHSKHPNNPYMFPSPKNGGMYYPDSVAKLHMKIRKDAGLEHIRFHDLRHTFATLALQNGVDVKTVSSMLGHYDAGFTLRTYTHATRQMQEQAAEKLGSFMAQVM